MGGTYRVRLATIGDAPVIAGHRAAMFRDMGERDDSAEVEARTRDQLVELIRSGEYVGWLVEVEGPREVVAGPSPPDIVAGLARRQVVAGLGVFLRRRLPRYGNLSGGSEAYVLNVYTEPAHRRRGLATRLLDLVIAWCRERGINRVALHASEDGRRLYEKLGFESTNEMRLVINE